MVRPNVQWSALGIVAVAAVAMGAGGEQGRDVAPEPGKIARQGPVVVELFTSQGCSSCPPADRLLSRLKRDPGLAGAVIPLAFHVDYWNHLGWSDPFSSPLWSLRQQDYAHAFRSNRIYTPQLVINGRTECVGSEESTVMRRIREALAAAPAVEVSLAEPPPAGGGGAGAPAEAGPLAGAGAAAGGGAAARVTVSARLLRPIAGPGLEAWVALTESGLTTAVGAGENARATLRNDQVVRRLVKAFTLPGTAGAASSAQVTLPVDGRWNRAALDVVAFLQDPRSLVIYGAASRPLTAH